jgi:predicted RNA-binding Zn ribbon-like protein
MLLPGTHRFNLVGGHPVLDFLNTVGSHRLVTPREDLQTPEDLVSWGLQSGWLDADRAQTMLVEIQLRPGTPGRRWDGCGPRESLYRVFLAISEGGHPAPGGAGAAGARAPGPGASGGWSAERWRPALGRLESARLDAVIPPLALAAVELLTGARRPRLCEATALDGCGWLFLDVSRNGRRRWCEMKSCGNKYKARRHAARARAAGRRVAE